MRASRRKKCGTRVKYIVREYVYMHADDRVRANQWLVPQQQEPRAKGAEQPGQTNGKGASSN